MNQGYLYKLNNIEKFKNYIYYYGQPNQVNNRLHINYQLLLLLNYSTLPKTFGGFLYTSKASD